jgi:hypothetical protein
MEDRLQDLAAGVGNVSILPVERNTVGRVIPVVEAQCAATGRNRKLLIEGAVSERFWSTDVPSQC